MTAGQRQNECDGPPSGRPRGALQLEESRRSFQRQVEQLKDIDDKAMRSVRTAVVVIGFVVAAVGVVTRIGNVRLGYGSAIFTGFGVLFLIVTVVTGVGTATITEYRTRLTEVERARLERPAGGYPQRTAELVRIYHAWLDATEDELSESAASLGATLTALALGVLSLSIAGALAVLESTYLLEDLSPLHTVLLNLFAVVSVLVALGLGTKLTLRGVNTYL